MQPASEGPEDALSFLRACAGLLFANGQTTERTVDGVQKLAAHLGLPLTVHPRWGDLVLLLPGPDGSERIETIPVLPAGVEMHKVTQTLRLMDAVREGRVGLSEARGRIAQLAKLPPVSLLRFAGLAGAGAAALGVIFGTRDPLALFVIVASAAAGACLRRGLSRLVPNPLPQPLGAALLAALVAILAAPVMPNSALLMIALCPCLVLVPGPHLLNGALDLARLRVPLALERLAYAGLLILMIAIGLIAGLSLGGESLPLAAGGAPVPLMVDVIAAGIAVAAYGTFFSMPWRMLPVPMMVGMCAHALHWVVLALGGGPTGSAFAACLLVGTVVTPISRRLHAPFAAFAFASVVSLIPGSYVFRMADALRGLADAGDGAAPQILTAAVVNGSTALFIVVAMACGLILPKMLIEALARKTEPGGPV